MALLEFSNLRFGYSDEIIIVEAAGALQPGNVIGFVGANGGGKTTLLRLLIGELTPDSGNLQRARSTKIAHVAQAASGDMATPLYDYVQGGRPELIELEHQIARLSEELARPQPGCDLEAEAAEHEALLTRLGRAQEALEDRGGHGWEHMVERLLLGLAFTPAQFKQPIGQLSGGQLQKGRLARQLLSDANCIILDEPTNHLDLDSQAFLVDWLRALTGRGGGAGLPSARGDCGVLLVSHDRWLLDALCDHIWEIDNGVLYRYPGNYSKYLPQREARRKLAREQYETQREQIARTEEYIRRNIAGQNTKQAQGRRTHLQRMERLEAPGSDPAMSFILKPALRTGEQVLVVEDLAFAYEKRTEKDAGESISDSPESRVLSPEPADRNAVAKYKGEAVLSQDSGQSTSSKLSLNPSLDYVRSQPNSRTGRLAIARLEFQVMRGERLGIVGPNGCGKTTLLKLLTRALPPLNGMIAWGSNVELGVFSQDSADLGRGLNLISELRSADPLITDSAAREYLARFGFSGDDVMKDVGGLSGGERSRLSLAKLFRKRPNVLVFDEPTNHLDIYAREAIEQFLEGYEGTIIMVTHDRALLERLCDRLLIFERAPVGADLVSARAPGGPGLGDSSKTAIDGRTQGSPLQAEQPGFSQVYFRGHYSEYLKWKESSGGGSIAAGSAALSARDSSTGPGLAPGQSVEPDDGRGQAPALQGKSSRAFKARPGLPSPEHLAELARAERCSPPQYCRKQLQRLEKRGMELESQIESGEEQIQALEQQQRDADSRGEFTQIAKLQEQIDSLRGLLDGQYSELEQNMAGIEAWAELEFIAGV